MIEIAPGYTSTTSAEDLFKFGVLSGYGGGKGLHAFKSPQIAAQVISDRLIAVSGLNGDLGITYTDLSYSPVAQVDPLTGARLPRGFQRVRYRSFTGEVIDTALDDSYRKVEFDTIEVDGEPVIVRSRARDGIRPDGSFGATVQIDYDRSGRAINTEVKINDNPLFFDLSDVGSILGRQLGIRIANGNPFVDVGASALLQTLGNNLGDVVDGIIGRVSVDQAVSDAFGTFGSEFVSNLKSAGIGAISSYLTSQLINVLGVDGFAGEALNVGAGFVIGQIVNGIAAGKSLQEIFADLGSTQSLGQLAGAAASFLGSKLSDEIYSPETIGGQIGGAVGSSLAGIVNGAELTAALATGNPTVILAAFAISVVRTVVWKLVGSLIGSIFGGTPRSGADVVWNDDEERFSVANGYSRKGGSRETAEALAGSVANLFNGVIDASGARLADPKTVTTGNYGMRKSDFVYRPTSTRDKDAITFRVSTKGDDNAFSKVVGYGIWQGLTDPDFQLVGGSNYVKRAIYATFERGGMSATNFDQAVLLGNIASAQSYEAYIASSIIINSLTLAGPNSVFAAETTLNLVRAQELGLTKRHRSDWFGGFGALLEDAGVSAATVDFGFDYDPFSDQISRLIGVGNFVLGDTIDIAGQTTLERLVGENTVQIIDLRAGNLFDQTGYVVNGNLRDDVAHGNGADFNNVVNTGLSISGANLRTGAPIIVTAVESTEKFRVALGDGSGTYLMRAEADVTIVASSELAHLMVGRAYANEGDHLVWRVSLSKSATTDVTLGLTINEDGAASVSVARTPPCQRDFLA